MQHDIAHTASFTSWLLFIYQASENLPTRPRYLKLIRISTSFLSNMCLYLCLFHVLPCTQIIIIIFLSTEQNTLQCKHSRWFVQPSFAFFFCFFVTLHYLYLHPLQCITLFGRALMQCCSAPCWAVHTSKQVQHAKEREQFWPRDGIQCHRLKDLSTKTGWSVT